MPIYIFIVMFERIVSNSKRYQSNKIISLAYKAR